MDGCGVDWVYASSYGIYTFFGLARRVARLSAEVITMKYSDHYTNGRRWSYISKAWIFDTGWTQTEEIARLEHELAARTRALASCEQHLIDANSQIEALKNVDDDPVGLWCKIYNLPCPDDENCCNITNRKP